MGKEVIVKGIIEKDEVQLIKRLIFLLVVSVILMLLGSVSYYVYSKYLYNPVLLAPGDDVLNIFVVDDAMGLGTVSDSILFEGEWGSLQETQIPSSLPQTGPKPLVIINAGTVPADINIKSTGTQLFSDPGSLFQFRVHSYKFNDVEVGSGYEESANNCFDDSNNPLCFVSTPCSDWCDFGFDIFTTAIYGLEPNNLGDGYGDEVIIEIRVQPAIGEPSGLKSTTIQINGVESG